MNPNGEKTEPKLYIGNLDMRITEGLYSRCFLLLGRSCTRNSCCILVAGKAGSLEAFLSSSIVAKRKQKAKEKMHGRLACGRPLVVRLSSERDSIQEPYNPSGRSGEATKTSLSASSSGQMSRSSKIAEIKNKPKALEGEGFCTKKQKQDNIPSSKDNKLP